MCIFKPKIPKVEPLAPPPTVKPEPDKPDAVPESEPLREEDEKAEVTYGSRPSDALLSNNTGGSTSVINLIRDSLNSAGGSQHGLSGGTTA